jgi:hypothetical protein
MRDICAGAGVRSAISECIPFGFVDCLYPTGDHLAEAVQRSSGEV